MTLRQSNMLTPMKRLVELFAPYCADRGTLDELHRMISDKQLWPKAHALFDRIRLKTLRAQSQRDEKADYQYFFEEICAKTIFNLTDTKAPFDADSPYWVVPSALTLARRLGIHDSEITKIVAA